MFECVVCTEVSLVGSIHPSILCGSCFTCPHCTATLAVPSTIVSCTGPFDCGTLIRLVLRFKSAVVPCVHGHGSGVAPTQLDPDELHGMTPTERAVGWQVANKIEGVLWAPSGPDRTDAVCPLCKKSCATSDEVATHASSNCSGETEQLTCGSCRDQYPCEPGETHKLAILRHAYSCRLVHIAIGKSEVYGSLRDIRRVITENRVVNAVREFLKSSCVPMVVTHRIYKFKIVYIFEIYQRDTIDMVVYDNMTNLVREQCNAIAATHGVEKNGRAEKWAADTLKVATGVYTATKSKEQCLALETAKAVARLSVSTNALLEFIAIVRSIRNP